LRRTKKPRLRLCPVAKATRRAPRGRLYFHGHPINRQEARRELKLKVVENPPAALETAMIQTRIDTLGRPDGDRVRNGYVIALVRNV
jgi:hypothetical protein